MSSEISEGKGIGNYSVIRELGRGNFSNVWLAEHVKLKKEVAIKVIPIENLQEPQHKLNFAREINLLKMIDHPFVVQIYETIQTEKNWLIVMEYVPGGSLLQFVDENSRLLEMSVKKIFIQIISALNYLHNEKMIAHRDLKVENVMLDQNHNIRLIDFGFSNSFTSESETFSTACGSPAYIAPEIITGQKYTKRADIWSAGVILYALSVGDVPFKDNDVQKQLQKVAYSEPIYPPYLSTELIDLIKKMLIKRPDRRMNLFEIIQHPWVASSSYSKILSVTFSIHPDWETHSVNPKIIDYIRSLGYDTSELPYEILQNDFTEITSIYKMLKKEQLIYDLSFPERYSISKTGGSNIQLSMSQKSRSIEVFRTPIESKPSKRPHTIKVLPSCIPKSRNNK